MTAGRLAASKPGATTNTVLYRTPITKSASTVLQVCNQSGSGASYRAALRDYEQVLHLDGLNTSAYKFAKVNPEIPAPIIAIFFFIKIKLILV